MIRNRVILKSIAVFIILETVFSTISPTISWALTAGPSAPEFSSFEPVDTTDMVNLATGDLIYNMPILNVPGPSGGYPLSLSYHAGIKPEQEASWVGLGWTLNPGAINRSVNMFADDNLEARGDVRDYWNGGETVTRTTTLGVSAFGVGMSYTIAKTEDTFKGFSTNEFIGGQFNPVSFGLSMSNSMGGGSAYDVGPEEGKWGQQLFQLTPLSNTSMDFSISSTGKKSSSVTVAGYTHQFNGKGSGSGSAIHSFSSSTSRGSFSLGPFSVGLRDYYTRYWSDQSDALFSYGALYSSENNKVDYMDNTTPDNFTEFRSYTNDIYDLYEPGTGIVSGDQADPARQVGGSMPAYDGYTVSAQGLGGLMQPYIFDNIDIKGRNQYQKLKYNGIPMTNYPTLKYLTLAGGTPGKKMNFRFRNEYSNKISVGEGQLAVNGASNGFTVSDRTLTGVPAGFTNTGSDQKLAGARNVTWFTNYDIVHRNGTAGFVDYYANAADRPLSKQIYDEYLQPESCLPRNMVTNNSQPGRQMPVITTDKYDEEFFQHFATAGIYAYSSLDPRTISIEDRIGGFMITNESGVTYHYGLPVYAYNEYTRTKLKKPVKGSATITEIRRNDPYAYTWLLTAITGPDFVDRGGSNGSGNGMLDDGDYGYWVKFDYGLWTDSYQWRTPHTGYSIDAESEYETFSYGMKELYYLDAIETKTHKALFVKSKRKDGRGVTSRLEGGSNPRRYSMSYKKRLGNNWEEFANLKFSVSPVSTMKLDAIYLMDKKTLASIPLTKARGSKYNEATVTDPLKYRFRANNGSDYQYTISDSKKIIIEHFDDHIPVKYHNGDLVLDDGDIMGLDLAGDALRVIQFNTSYKLTDGTKNSIGYFTDILDRHLMQSCAVLTSTGCENFSYDFEWPSWHGYLCGDPIRRDGFSDERYAAFCCGDHGDQFAFYSDDPLGGLGFGGSCSESRATYAGGELRYLNVGKLTLEGIKTLGYGGADLIPSTNFAYESNPAYGESDDWGYYKSDFDIHLLDEYHSGNFFYGPLGVLASRRITPQSAQNMDAWSLTSITSPTGATLNVAYEPHDYYKSIYNDNIVFGIERVERVSTDQMKIFFNEKGLDLSSYFSVNQSVDLKALVVGTYTAASGTPGVTGDIYDTPSNQITSVGDTYVIVTAAGLNQLLAPGRLMLPFQNPPEIFPYFISGAVSISDNAPVKYAGGVRVKSLSISELGGHESTTEFLYRRPNMVSSSGVTSFKPFTYIGVHYPTDIQIFSDILSTKERFWETKGLMDSKAEFQKTLNKLHEKVLMFSREAPGPGVIYEWVTTRHFFDGLPQEQYQVHQFKAFEESMVTRTVNDYGTTSTQRRNIALNNRTAPVGSIMKIFTYASVDQRLLNEIRFGYLNDGSDTGFEATLQNQKQGVMEQSFQKGVLVQEFRTQYNSDGNDLNTTPALIYQGIRSVITKKEEWPSVMTWQESIDYVNGHTERSENRVFDFFSGQPTRSRYKDGLGSTYETDITPAYRVYPYMGLGAKGFANMLSQVASTMTYKIDETNGDAKQGLVQGSVQTWSPNRPYIDHSGMTDWAGQPFYRKHKAYTFIGDDNVALRPDGLYPATSVVPFTAWQSADIAPSVWRRDAETTLYSASSLALEVMDINGDYSTNRMSVAQDRIIATGAGVRYHEFIYSGAETPSTTGKVDDITLAQAQVVSTAHSHSGAKAFLLEAGAFGLQSTLRIQKKGYDRKLRVSFWLRKPAEFHAFPPVPQLKRSVSVSYAYYDADLNTTGNVVLEVPLDDSKTVSLSSRSGLPDERRQLCMVDIPMPQSVIQNNEYLTLELINTGEDKLYVDDFRAYPLGAAVVSYVYNERNEMICMLDANNIGTFYDYDDMGRLKATTTESFSFGRVRASEIAYNYGRDHVPSFTVDESKSGSSGSISPVTTSTTVKGGTLSFRIKETCTTSPQLAQILIDNQPVGIQNTTITLFDGTRVTIDGLLVTFQNLQSSHTLKAKFNLHEGEVLCQQVSTLPGQCFDGSYVYAYYNGCGERGEWRVAPNASAVPTNLKHRIPSNCLELNNTSACSQN